MKKKDGKKYVRRERHCYSKCERQFYVGNIKDEDIKAKFKDGILKISVPKEEEKERNQKSYNDRRLEIVFFLSTFVEEMKVIHK